MEWNIASTTFAFNFCYDTMNQPSRVYMRIPWCPVLSTRHSNFTTQVNANINGIPYVLFTPTMGENLANGINSRNRIKMYCIRLVAAAFSLLRAKIGLLTTKIEHERVHSLTRTYFSAHLQFYLVRWMVVIVAADIFFYQCTMYVCLL